MSIDFSKITGWSDQYGVVVQVADENGVVLWSAGKPVLLYFTIAEVWPITVNGVQYQSEISGMKIKAGDTVVLHASYVSIDGSGISPDDADVGHEWIVPDGISQVYIYAAYPGLSLMTVDTEGLFYFYIVSAGYMGIPGHETAVDGMTWAEWLESDYNDTGLCVRSDGYVGTETQGGSTGSSGSSVPPVPGSPTLPGGNYDYVVLDGVKVVGTDTIIPGAEYTQKNVAMG